MPIVYRLILPQQKISGGGVLDYIVKFAKGILPKAISGIGDLVAYLGNLLGFFNPRL